jgi:hypothetical protein
MAAVSREVVAEQLTLADALRAGRDSMLVPQDLPGRYGRVVKALDHVLDATQCMAALGGGWAVWRHGYLGRVTQDIDIVLPADKVDEFLRLASVSGFEVLPVPAGRWPKMLHRETSIEVDILPEGARPGTATKPAPTTIPHPSGLRGAGQALEYMSLPALVQLKLAAGRVQDEADIVRLVQANADKIETIRQHLVGVHCDYVTRFDHLVERAADEDAE